MRPDLEFQREGDEVEVWRVLTIQLWMEIGLSFLPIGCDVDTSVEDHISHFDPSWQFFNPCPDFPQFLQRCRYLHSASDFLQVLALNLLHISGLSLPLFFEGFLGVVPSELPSIPSGITMAE